MVKMPRPRRQYKCDRCGIITENSTTFKRHMARKTPCNPGFDENDPNISVAKMNISVAKTNISVAKMNISVAKTNIPVANADSLECPACRHVFSTSSSLRRHQNAGTCAGREDHLACADCGARFQNKHAKQNHKRRGKCVPASQTVVNNTTNNITNNNNNITNNANCHNTTNNVTNVYLAAFGSENVDPISTAKFHRYLLKYSGAEMLIPAAKAMYFHPGAPENHGAVRQRSVKQNTVETRRKDGSYGVSHCEASFIEFAEYVLPVIARNAEIRRIIESELSGNNNTKHVLAKRWFSLFSRDDVKTRDELSRDAGCASPPDSDEEFVWPSALLRGMIAGGFDAKKHVIYFDRRGPGDDELFGICGLYRYMYDRRGSAYRLPPGAEVRTMDNGLDHRWQEVAVWDTGEWRELPGAGPGDDSVDHFYARMAVDIGRALVEAYAGDPVFGKTLSPQLRAISDVCDELSAGRLRREYARAMSW